MMIADIYVKGEWIEDLSIGQLDHVLALLVEDRFEADVYQDADLYIRCSDALDEVLEHRFNRMPHEPPHE